MTSHDTPYLAAAQTRLRIDIAHPARVYDCFLGGKDNFAADRDLAAQIEAVVPTVPAMARANRAFIHRAIRHLVQAGVRQFLDIGTGIPTAPNLHQVAQRLAPDCRVVYVDNDPLVLVHARALLTSTPQGRCAYLDADMRDPDAILGSREVADTLDLNQPVAVSYGSVLMLLPDEANPWAHVATIMDAMSAGSHLVVSHPTCDMDPNAMAVVAEVTRKAGVTFVPRTTNAIARFFGDLALVEPGLVPVLAWRPDTPVNDPSAAYYLVGVARK
jgi:hypothetical protein